MTSGNRGSERAVAEALVTLADSLVDDFDMIELLHRLTSECVRLLPVDAAGLFLSDQRGALQLVSSSTEQARLLELFQLQTDEGPCLDCFQTSHQVSSIDLAQVGSRWPKFTARALEAGFAAVHALPLRLRDDTIGALNLFSVTASAMGSEELRIGQALADVATISILQERAIRRGDIVNEQLQAALNSRIIIEQAKGVLAERDQTGMNEAFTVLRRYARTHNRRLTEVASEVVNGTLLISTSEPAATGEQTA
jgi:GAF domain-containing protein